MKAGNIMNLQKYIDYKKIHKLFQLTDGRFIRKVKWDECWHLCLNHPLSWDYNRIRTKSLGGYMSHMK